MKTQIEVSNHVSTRKLRDSPGIIISKEHHDAQMDCSWIAKPLSMQQMQQGQRSSKAKRPKMLSSKSLGHLVPRRLFFKQTNCFYDNISVSCKDTANSCDEVPNSFGNDSRAKSSASWTLRSTFIASKVPRQSSSNSFGKSKDVNKSYSLQSNVNCAIEQPSLSPIAGENRDEVCDMSWTENTSNGSKTTFEDQQNHIKRRDELSQGLKSNHSSEDQNDNNVNQNYPTKYRPFKSTGLALRDVKNSIGLRLKAKHSRQAFGKLHEEKATPPTKLYSPFDIHSNIECVTMTPTSIWSQSSTDPAEATRVSAKKALGLNSNKSKKSLTNTEPDKIEKQRSTTFLRLLGSKKFRLARPNKKTCLEKSRFDFDSPAGRLRQSVRDVQDFQKRIEAMSEVIENQVTSESSFNPKFC